jgi:hypothetical protein
MNKYCREFEIDFVSIILKTFFISQGSNSNSFFRITDIQVIDGLVSMSGERDFIIKLLRMGRMKLSL